MDWLDITPKSGDIIRTKVSFYYHYGIFVNENEVIQFGLPDNVFRPASEIAVLSSDIYTFIGDGNLEVGQPSKEEKKKMRPKKEIIKLAKSRIGEGGYDILHNNCEHFVNECAFGESYSSFLDEARARIRSKLNKTQD